MKNKMITYSDKGIHLYNSKAGFTSRAIAEASIETRAIEREIFTK